ncbi:hypothetical protein T552_02781 [Pneumocystis carinii B80]|uniref:RNB domain-containing protein n=1 Tax=Pneumocystis carinii (strain B80) TaxID=1408658 RepID=A0A0W4ZEI4_PNEC8|nr:hypothetical protein T552_02781 [Pneumocystis carinii B80]KTW26780.1 hypothetical protein T552_02781 [Pneumocystis carinii B80]
MIQESPSKGLIRKITNRTCIKFVESKHRISYTYIIWRYYSCFNDIKQENTFKNDYIHEDKKLIEKKDIFRKPEIKIRQKMIEKYGIIQNQESVNQNTSKNKKYKEKSYMDDMINIEKNIFNISFKDISPGDLVEIRKSEYGILGIVIQKAAPTDDGFNVLLSNRKVIHCKPGDILFLIPSFFKNFSNIELSNLKIINGYISFNNPDFQNIIRSLRYFKLKSQYFYKKFLTKFDNLYQRLHHPNPDQHTYINILDLCRSEYKISKPNFIHLYAIHTLLANDPCHYVLDSRNQLYLNRYEVRPKIEVEMIKNVSHWIRVKSPEFLRFIEKASNIIEIYREKKMHNMQDTILPRKYAFSETDVLFIKFIRQYFLERRQFQNSIYLSLIPQILKATKMYNSVMDRENALLFMEEIGAWAPWENYARFDRNLSLPGLGTSIVMDILFKKITDKSNLSSDQLKNFSLKDSFENLRHDFGQLPVYVIDDSDATELDDGISIEKKSNDETWLHIHIADPGAFVSPNSDISNFASNLVATVFTPEKRYHMLPHPLTSSLFSLDSPLKKHSVLTFSAKLDKNGKILDFKISPAYISNIKKLSYDDIDNDVFDVSLKNISYCFSTEFPNTLDIQSIKQKKDQMSSLDKISIHDIYNISLLRLQYRISRGFWQYSTTSANIKVQYSKPYHISINDSPQFFQNYPSIRNIAFDLLDSPSRVMVSEIMILAGEIAAKFCVERKLPVPFRSQDIISNHECRYKYNQILERRNFATGRLSLKDGMELINYTGPTIISTSPSPHLSLAIDHYIQATSPLRRYCDLVTHWQIQASLKGKGNNEMPFSKEYLDSSLLLWFFKEKTSKNFGKLTTKLWVCILLLRIGLDKLSPFHAWVCSTQDRKLLVTGIIKELGVNCKINSKKHYNNNPGDLIQIKITQIDLVDKVIYAYQI